MRRAAVCFLAFLAGCSPPGYRSPKDSAKLEREVEDRNVETRVRMALTNDPQTAPYGSIRVTCVEGVVTLEGVVPRTDARARAVKIAQGTQGVRRVVDSLRPR